MGEAPSEGPPVADLRMGDEGHGLAQQRRALGHERIALQPPLAGHGADAQPAVLAADVVELAPGG